MEVVLKVEAIGVLDVAVNFLVRVYGLELELETLEASNIFRLMFRSFEL